jgi:hypothetical protein
MIGKNVNILLEVLANGWYIARGSKVIVRR